MMEEWNNPERKNGRLEEWNDGETKNSGMMEERFTYLRAQYSIFP